MTIWTIGHSTHTLETFVALLDSHGVDLVADVRAAPHSRRHPHFERAALERTLPQRGVLYAHLRLLGGWRRPAALSPNGAWRNQSFRGYADYAMGEEVARGFAQLRHLAATRRTAAMCSEALWWRCHRRLVADRLVVAGDSVCHIASDGCTARHQLATFATAAADGTVTYPVVG